MQSLVLSGQLILPGRIVKGTIVCENGRIVEAGPGRRKGAVDLGDAYIAPGYVDLHVHGGWGADYMDGSPDSVRVANRCHLAHGTTTIFPTTTTGSPESLHRMLDACIAVKSRWTHEDGARIGGVHLYGPYFAEDKVGCHSPEGRRDPRASEYEDYLSLGIVRIATCAAELPGAEDFYRAARKRRCLVTCGHSNATWGEMERAFKAGVRHVDHFWCAMSSVLSIRQRCGTPMMASMEQFVLAQPDMSTEVIADGEHLSPELLRFALRFKGPERLCLVTDASRAVDMPAGRYRFGSAEEGSWFESNERVGFVPGSGLASTVCGMDRMVQVMARATGAPLHEIIRMATLTPAERAGVASTCGSLEPGKFADFLVLDRRLRAREVYLNGLKAQQHVHKK